MYIYVCMYTYVYIYLQMYYVYLYTYICIYIYIYIFMQLGINHWKSLQIFKTEQAICHQVIQGNPERTHPKCLTSAEFAG